MYIYILHIHIHDLQDKNVFLFISYGQKSLEKNGLVIDTLHIMVFKHAH